MFRVPGRLIVALFCVGAWSAANAIAAAPMAVTAPGFKAEFSDGALSLLIDSQGHTLVGGLPADENAPLGIGLHYNLGAGMDTDPDAILKADTGRRKDTAAYAAHIDTSAQCAIGQDVQARFTDFAGLNGASAAVRYRVENPSGDLVIIPSGTHPDGDLWGVSWAVGPVARDLNLIVPTGGGKILRWNAFSGETNIDLPMSEAPLVIAEGAGYGFSVSARDPAMRFKRMRIKKGANGWLLRFFAINQAPFKDAKSAESPPWHVNVFQGDWRVPARAYRAWAEQAYTPVPVADQKPAWARDIRFIVTSRLYMGHLEALAKAVDSKQTLIFLPWWRKQFFDRDYPSYDQFPDDLLPFIKRAQELGFRVMLYTNFFQVSYDNAYYPQVRQFQILKENGQRRGWVNNSHVPPVQGAYINPASAQYRKEFISRMVKLIEQTGADAIHLDQNFHAHNDFNGRIDGMDMPEGVMALHRELREALPNVALGGEGINELTYRYLSFAQRHVFLLMRNKIDRKTLEDAHPITSYLFSPYVKFYGWLGFPAPFEEGQAYAAWRDVYQYWGILPSMKIWTPAANDLLRPKGFTRLALEEAAFWQKEKIEPDMDADWPADVCFPFRAADGRRVVRTKDRRLMLGDQVISRTLVDVSETNLPGSISDWLFYNKEKIFGLNPSRWYAYFPDPRDLSVPHVESITPQWRTSAALRNDWLMLLNIETTEKIAAGDGEVNLAGVQKWRMFAYNGKVAALSPQDGSAAVRLSSPGTLVVMKNTPPAVTLPFVIKRVPHLVMYFQDNMLQERPPNIWIKLGELSIAGEAHKGLFIHPPSRGRAVGVMPLTLPPEPARFECVLGMDERRKAAKGLTLAVEVNGKQIARQATKLGPWIKFEVDLSPYAGTSITLAFIAEAKGDATHDYVLLGEPQLVKAAAPAGGN